METDTSSQWRNTFQIELKNLLRLLFDIRKDAAVAVDLKFVVINILALWINAIVHSINQFYKLLTSVVNYFAYPVNASYLG